VVECNLAKVEVEGSNPFSRSTFPLFHTTFIFQAPWPSGKAEVCKTFIGGSSPPGASNLLNLTPFKQELFLTNRVGK
jgi:hypothetical protein